MRIERLLEDQGKTQQELVSSFGLDHSTYSKWKLGKVKTYLKQINSIANYFYVSPGYLLCGTEDGPGEGTKGALEDEMILVFREMSPKRQELLI